MKTGDLILLKKTCVYRQLICDYTVQTMRRAAVRSVDDKWMYYRTSVNHNDRPPPPPPAAAAAASSQLHSISLGGQHAVSVGVYSTDEPYV